MQLREKELDREGHPAGALRIRDLCRKYQVPLLLTMKWNWPWRQMPMEFTSARAIWLSGMPESSWDPEKIIGVSARTLEEAWRQSKTGRTIWEWGQCSLPPPNRTPRMSAGNPKLHLPGGIDPCGSHRRHQKGKSAGAGRHRYCRCGGSLRYFRRLPDIRKAAEELRQLSEAAAAGKAGVTG